MEERLNNDVIPTRKHWHRSCVKSRRRHRGEEQNGQRCSQKTWKIRALIPTRNPNKLRCCKRENRLLGIWLLLGTCYAFHDRTAFWTLCIEGEIWRLTVSDQRIWGIKSSWVSWQSMSHRRRWRHHKNKWLTVNKSTYVLYTNNLHSGEVYQTDLPTFQ